MIFTDQQQLDEALAKWQKILRLQDWEIQALLVPENRMTDGIGSYGTCSPRIDLNWAEVCINEVAVMSSGSPIDHEQILVHELIHVAQAGFTRCIKKGTLEFELFEAFTQKLSMSLIALDRQES